MIRVVEIEGAADVLRGGGLVAFPTETVYGLGADASSPIALRRLFAAKGRPADHPVIVHLAEAGALDAWSSGVSDDALALTAAFWPGPLTVVVSRARHVPDEVTGGLDTVGLRVPDQPVALALLRAFAATGGGAGGLGGLAAPSANRFGHVSPTTADAVRAELGADVDVVLDGGACTVGVESTIVDCSRRDPADIAILRVGGIAQEQVEAALGRSVALHTTGMGSRRAPGTLASHYAPSARVELTDVRELDAHVRAAVGSGLRVGVIGVGIDTFAAPTGQAGDVSAGEVVMLATPSDDDEYAQILYAALRDADTQGTRCRDRGAPGRRGNRRGSGRPSAPGRGAPTAPRRTMMDAHAPIGVFDSGLGGLTVLRALIDVLPDESMVYFGDNARSPYGPKPHDEVHAHAVEIADLLVARGVKALVVACNSATAAALDTLQERFTIPVVGVIEPGLRAAMNVTRSGRVGVIGTVGTIASGSYQRAAEAIDPNVELTCAACPGFVEFVEAGDVDSDQVHVLAERLLAPVRYAGVDTLVLGCTHYPLLARTIGDAMGRDVVLVSSADETAFAVRDLLADEKLLVSAPNGADHTFLTSGSVETFGELGARFLGPEVAAVEGWRWS